MRISVKIISILVLLAAIAVIMACDTNTIPSEESTTIPVTYTVAFRSQFNDPESITEMPNPTTKTVTTPATTIDSLPTPPSMSGYRFGGWYTSPNANGASFDENYPVNDTTTLNGKITVYAYWYKFKVSFYSDSTTLYSLRGVMPPSKTVATMPSPPTPPTNFTFAGWNKASNGSGTEFIYSTPVTADIDVYAKWVSNTNTVYAVTYDSEGGTTVGTQYVVVTPPATSNVVGTLPSAPTRPFYTFDRWWEEVDDGGGQFTESTAVTKNMIVHAHWIADSGWTVTYDSQGGTAVDPQYVILSSGNTVETGTAEGSLPTPPTKRCYSFAHWYTVSDDSETEFTASTPVSTNTPVYAKWTWNYPSTEYPERTPPFAPGDYGPSCVGKVFYIEEGSNGYRGLEAAPANWVVTGDPYVEWINGDPQVDETTKETYQRTQLTLNGKTSTAIGIVNGEEVGLTNSKAIMAQVEAVGGTTIPYAAKLCLDYSVGEGAHIYDDWFLPSRDELAQLYATQDKTHWWGFAEDYYWTSSEYSAKNAWSQHFTTGEQIGTYKNYQRLVRPVRRFVFVE